MFRQTLLSVALLLLAPIPQLAADETLAQRVVIPSDQTWTDTGLDFQQGRPLHVEATGSVRVVGWRVRDWFFGVDVDRTVSPQGTYLWPKDYKPSGTFPLPTMAEGPFPAFCFIGKIGEHGAPFYVGARYDGSAEHSGRLWLGINDDHPGDNDGDFIVAVQRVSKPPASTPPPPLLEAARQSGHPIPHARVLLLYVDGLRPDVLHAMASAGFLPHFKALFLDRGVEIPNAFTTFPSNTLIANGALFTGLFPDRTGIKSQSQFERSTLKPRGQLSRWLPDGFMPMPTTRVIDLLDKYAPENTHTFLVKRGIPTLATRLGKAYKFTTLPIAPLNPPPQWLHRAVNTLGPFGLSVQLPLKLDQVNAQYAIEDLVGDPDAHVIAVWLPMVDTISHHSRRGQFGAARRDLVLADRYVGRLLKRLREVHWERSTYLVLVSDHGHLGGENTSNRRCNFPRDWAHRQLGCNAKVVGQEWMHPGIDPKRFLFFDNQGAGQAALFLPYGSYFYGPWRRNRLYELTHYDLRPGQQGVNLLESLMTFHPEGWDGTGQRPVDLILVKLDEHQVLIYRDTDCQAILHRDIDVSGHEVYRYEPVRRLTQDASGTIHYESPLPGVDPLGYLQDPTVRSAWGSDATLVTQPHTATEWLQATFHTRYPDAVVEIAKFFAWQPPVTDLADVRDPDLVVTASPGWSFRSDETEGTDHGYPLADSMRISLFLSGPNVVHGVLISPHRIVDVLPTILEMIGRPAHPGALDGETVTGIYE